MRVAYEMKVRYGVRATVGTIVVPEIKPDGSLGNPAYLVSCEEALKKMNPKVWLVLTPGGWMAKFREHPEAPVSEKVIPNAVGRLDDVTEAMKAGDDRLAVNLMWERSKVVAEKRAEAQRQLDKHEKELRSILDFSENYTKDPEFRAKARLQCGRQPE